MPILHAIVLGITQGLTEFFPISSSGHLALVPWLFGWDDFGNDESLAKAFDVALHMGTLVGALAYFRRDVVKYTKAGIGGLFERDEPMSEDGRIAWLLVGSAIPAAITGAMFNSLIENLDDVIWLIAVMLVVFGAVLLWADRLPARRAFTTFGFRDAALMGVGQAMALQPGVSRSGVTISVGRWLGFDRDAAARISFLMSLPVIAGAGVYKALDVFTGEGVPEELYAAFFWGMVASGITGWVAVWATLRLVRKRSFRPFVVYRFVVAVGVLLLIVTSVRSGTL